MEEKDIDLGINPIDDIPVTAEKRRTDNGSIIRVMGVGGGGGNAVKHMYNMGITGVEFMICNTDAQALEKSPIPVKIQLGDSGLGAGAIPEVARNAALESETQLQRALEGTKMLFVTAGMGGGTGTGASPIVADIARSMGILTVGIVTYPFDFEGESKFKVADEGINELRQNVDALIVIKNELLKSYYPDLTISNAFAKSDDVLLVAAKSIAELITIPGSMNVDFNDVKTILKDSGTAIIGAGIAEGENRAREAAEAAIASPLLDQKSIYGAEKALLFISYGSEHEITMDELSEITGCLEEATCNLREKLIWGHGVDDTLDEKVRVTVIATGFHETAPEKPEKAHLSTEKGPEDPISVKEVGTEDDKTVSDLDFDIVPEPDAVEPVTISVPTSAPSRSQSSRYIDNSHLRGMSEADTDAYLREPAYKRRQQADGYECSSYRVGSYGITQDASAYLKNKESID
ncbi:MAG: cell division protein FtsZ [Bacteroidales bacterium]|nr:cell division protein FtsZ [Bacteroidales bacterium]